MDKMDTAVLNALAEKPFTPERVKQILTQLQKQIKATQEKDAQGVKALQAELSELQQTSERLFEAAGKDCQSARNFDHPPALNFDQVSVGIAVLEAVGIVTGFEDVAVVDETLQEGGDGLAVRQYRKRTFLSCLSGSDDQERIRACVTSVSELPVRQ